MSRMKDNWGNQELPGISNEELLSDDFSRRFFREEKSQAMTFLHQDPDYREKYESGMATVNYSEHSKQLHSDPSWRAEKYLPGREKMKANQSWQQQQKEKNKRLNSDPAIQGKKSKTVKHLHDSGHYNLSYQKKRKPFTAQGKMWQSAIEAAPILFPEKSLDRAVKTIRYLIKKQKPGWQYL